MTRNQWLDQASAEVLGFVARRLFADPFGSLPTARTIGFRRHLVMGCSFAAGTLLLALLHGHTWEIVCVEALVGFGAMVYAAMPSAVASVPVDQQAVTAATAATFGLLAGR